MYFMTMLAERNVLTLSVLRCLQPTSSCFCLVWWHRPILPALGRQRLVDFCEFRMSLNYIACSKPARGTQWDCVSHREVGGERGVCLWFLSIYFVCRLRTAPCGSGQPWAKYPKLAITHGSSLTSASQVLRWQLCATLPGWLSWF